MGSGISFSVGNEIGLPSYETGRCLWRSYRESERQIEEALTCAVRQTAYMLVSICIVPG